MSLSSFALVIGVFCYVFGFPLVFSDDKHLQWRKKLIKDENMLRLLGTALLMISVTTLRYHWRITPDGEGAVIVIAWLAFLKSLFMAWWPARFSVIASKMDGVLLADSSGMQMFTGFVMVLLGALFTYLGLLLI
jgi:hypothetical protein